MAEEHFLLPEEEELSYLDYVGAALKTAFPKTALVYDLLEDPIKEGVASATRPWDPQLDYTQAGKNIHYFQNYIDEIHKEILEGKTTEDDPSTMENLNWAKVRLEETKLARAKILPDKVKRFLKGALGKDLDYVEEEVEKKYPLRFIKDLYSHGRHQSYDVNFQQTAELLKEREDFRKIYETRTDILRLGLGLDQTYDSMVESDYKPTEEELRQITTIGEDAYVGQVGWKPGRPVWDFRDKNFYGFRGYAHKGGTPAGNLQDIVRQHGEFQSPEWKKYSQAVSAVEHSRDMSKEDRAYLDSKVEKASEGIPDSYEAFSDVWDFSIMDQPLIQAFGKSIGPTLGEALDHIEFYQAPQIYGRRYLEEE